MGRNYKEAEQSDQITARLRGDERTLNLPANMARYNLWRTIIHDLGQPLMSASGAVGVIEMIYRSGRNDSIRLDEMDHFRGYSEPIFALSMIFKETCITKASEFERDPISSPTDNYALMALVGEPSELNNQAVSAWLAGIRREYVSTTEKRKVGMDEYHEMFGGYVNRMEEFGSSPMSTVIEEMEFYVGSLCRNLATKPMFQGGHADNFETFYQIMERSSRTLERVIPDVRLIFGLESYAPIVTEVSIESLLSGVLEEVEGSRGRVSVSISEDVDCVLTDENLMGIVLRNMVGNACKYGVSIDEEGRKHPEPVEINVSTEDGEVKVAVADHGIGMEKKDVEGINDLDSLPGRNERVRDSFDGTGFAIFMIKRILREKLGGRLVACSEGENSGTTFSLYLPR